MCIRDSTGVDCPQGVVIRLRSLLIFSAGLAIFQGRSYGSAKPRAEANNTYQEPITPSHGPQSDIALRNHALRASPTDLSQISAIR